jgi:hypothetical protein
MARLPDDAYFTPRPLALEICQRLDRAITVGSSPRILEPSAGTGSFVAAAAAVFATPRIVAVDIHGKHKGDCLAAGADSFHENSFLQLASLHVSKADLVLGNPPYSLAEEFVEHALGCLHDDASVAFLLRLSFLGSQRRLLGLFKAAPLRCLFPIAGRPSFTPDGRTDASEYGVFVWTKGWDGYSQIMSAIEWKVKP